MKVDILFPGYRLMKNCQVHYVVKGIVDIISRIGKIIWKLMNNKPVDPFNVEKVSGANY
jgi:hypothetical protein